ncbi:MAG: DEAD/DEAH box helicase, partial [Armatimonadetes bacterium]|nr:DEAD/DEAH box helicase [Armatimonadota bacterium]
MLFSELGLRAELLHALDTAGYKIPTPVQEQAIPAILTGGDVLAAAQTGTGKTAGFTLPLLHNLMGEAKSAAHLPHNSKNNRRTSRRPVRALILTPTRELAMQVEASVQTYGKFLPLVSTVVFGGVGIGNQMKALARGTDILVATPGRLLDHVGQGTVDLSQVEVLILDEADRMLDMGFVRDIRRIVPLLPTDRQTLMFSATFSKEIKALAGDFLREPTLIEIEREKLEAPLVEHTVYGVTTEQKRDVLLKLLTTETTGQTLVFTRTKHMADRIDKVLHQHGILSATIHGNRSQVQRTRALDTFKTGAIRVLVATDIAARGLDIHNLPFVVNYEIPNVPEDYVHRIGRTGRAGKSGEAISLVSRDEYKFLRDIEKLIGKTIDRRTLDGIESPLPEVGAAVPAGIGGNARGGN